MAEKNTISYTEAESLIKELQGASQKGQDRKFEKEELKAKAEAEETKRLAQQEKTEEARKLRLKEEEEIKIREEQRLKKDKEEQAKSEHNRKMALQEADHQQRLKEQEKNQKHEIKIAKIERDTEEIQRQNALKEYPVDYHLKFLLEKLDGVSSEYFKGEVHSLYIELFGKMNETFEKLGIISPDKLVVVKDDVLRINQIETIMDLYDEKIRNVKSDQRIEDDTEREEKIDNWKRLRDRDIAEIEQS